jgi:hypothetical protein
MAEEVSPNDLGDNLDKESRGIFLTKEQKKYYHNAY